MSLARYQAKRSFQTTPEPRGKVKKPSSKKFEFVIHKHQAQNLHYDLRLEMGGVLKSWAIPKGPSLNPKDRHLAVRVEDHPFEYRQFEGVIPEGNYGAGQVIIWDKGYYEPRITTKNPEKTLLDELKDGHITFVLCGKKLRGEFALIRSPKMGEDSWLLVKKRDKFAQSADITKQAKSVISGCTVEDLAKKAEPPNLNTLPKTVMPKRVKPMLAKLTKEAFDGQDWLFEIKWDGFRAIGSWDGKSAELYSRNNIDFSSKFVPVFEAMSVFKHKLVVDGEIVVIDKKGQAHFEWLQDYSTRPQGELRYFVFDLLWLDGHDLRGLPLLQRKQLLKQALPKNPIISYSDEVLGRGKKFFAAAQKQHLEGMMAKKIDSVYQSDKRTGDWLKVKTHLRQEIVIGGFTEPKGGRAGLGALLAGVYERSKLVYVGHVGTGFDNEALNSLRVRLGKLERRSTPFETAPKPNEIVHWISPKVVAEVNFTEWTKEGYMRQPVFVGLRPDKPAKKVVRELPVAKPRKAA